MVTHSAENEFSDHECLHDVAMVLILIFVALCLGRSTVEKRFGGQRSASVHLRKAYY